MSSHTDIRISIAYLSHLLLLFISVFCAGILFPFGNLLAEESICAVVHIEIKQEMTFERQAFDAHMAIKNGLTTISLENINVDVLFSDQQGDTVRASSNPDDPDALFFIRIESMEGIDGVTGTGTIAPAAIGDIHWLIIPAPASVENSPTGALYFVGARLSYTLGGEEHITHVTPDSIIVRPLPLLSLDYFLPDEVYGDDPFTVEVEPSIPFSLGVRISNNGHGKASDVKIDSAQPKIIDNEQGLLVDFLIEGSEVNGITAPDTLLIQFGDIGPESSTLGRWLMSCSLSGRFTEFKAEYSHSNDLGGELTSLIEDIETHFLVRDVLVDAPGRDAVRDFLGRDMDQLKVYESDAGVTHVADLSSGARVALISEIGGTAQYSVEVAPTAGFFYIQFSDPQGGEKLISEIIRSDGKKLKPDNGWLSKKRVEADWSFYANIFDFNSSGSYLLTMIDPALAPRPPAFDEQENPVQKEGEEVSFVVSLVDNSELATPDLKMLNAAMPEALPTAEGDTIECDGKTVISGGRLPVGARLIDRCDGTAILIWTPQAGQAGDYPLTFTATDGEFTTTVRYHLIITDAANTPTAQFSADTPSGEAPLTVLFIDESLSDDGISSWLWDFGDGTTSTEQIPIHTYEAAGLYSVSLAVVEIDGDEHSVSLKDYITVENDRIPVEFGHIAASSNWQAVELTEYYTDPVVVATYVGDTDPGVYSARIRAVSPSGFQVRAEGDQPLAEQSSGEISYVVMESGSHTLQDGSVVYARHLQSPADGGGLSHTFSAPFAEIPVVVSTVTSDNYSGSVTAALANITVDGFQLRLQSEETDLVHGTERIDWIAWEPGYGFIEGIVFEAGYLEQAGESWERYLFTEKFATAPSFVASRQDRTDTDSARAVFRSLDPLGVEAGLVPSFLDLEESESVSGSVGFIAVSSLSESSDSDGDGLMDLEERLEYGTHPGMIDTDLDGIDDNEELVYWGDRWNDDIDGDGFINLLDMDSDGDGFRDGLEILHGFDPADPEYFPTSPVMEIGRVALGRDWHTVQLAASYLDPVVVATVMESSGRFLNVNIRNITPESFEAGTTAEMEVDVSYIVMERSSYRLADGTRIVAGFSDAVPSDGTVIFSFEDEFAVPPVVMASPVSAGNPEPVSAAIRSVERENFVYSLQIDNATGELPASEQIGFIAWEPSAGTAGEFTFETGYLHRINWWWKEYQFSSPLYGIQSFVAISQETAEEQHNEPVFRDLTWSGIEARTARDSHAGFTYHGDNSSVGFIALSFVPADLDSDDDGLTDRDEIEIYGTHPALADTDGDGLDDGDEAAAWADGWNGDMDDDGLVNILDIDSDNDGYNDGLEFTHGFGPEDPFDFPDGPIMTFGSVHAGAEWQSVSFDREYLHPVFVATPEAHIFSQAAVGIRNVGATGFEIRCADQEDGGLDGIAVSYMVMERGTYILPGGEKVVAEHSHQRGWSRYGRHIFADPFMTSPVIIASIVDDSESEPVSVCLLRVNPFMFYSSIYTSTGYTYLKSPAGVDYIAWEPSTGRTETLSFSVNQFLDASQKWKRYQFDRDFSVPPALMAMIQKSDRSSPAAPLVRNISKSDFEMRIEPYFEDVMTLKSTQKMVGVIAISRNDE